MATIKVPEELKLKLDDAFQELEDTEYKLTKIASKTFSMVPIGYSEHGQVSIISQPSGAHICVRGIGVNDVLCTSAVVGVVHSAPNYIEFETVGGVYVLQRIEQEKTEKSQ